MNNGGPTIWLHNNEANRPADQDIISNAINHWEGLSPAPSESGMLRLDEWDLYADIQFDLGMGIWRVTSDIQVFDTNDGVRLWPGYFLRMTRDLDDPVATRPAPANSLWVRTCGKRHYDWMSEHNVEFINRNRLMEPGIDGRNNFVIYRVVPCTSKDGRDGDPEFVDGFNLASGEFLLQVTRAETVTSQRRIKDITGGEGVANTRSLQLCQNPWGLGQTIPRVRRDHPMGVHLPLARVLRQLKRFPSNNVTFNKDEIVLMIQPPETATGYAEVRDYEGKMGKIEPRNFEIIYDAFGIRLDPDAWGMRMQEMRDQHFASPTIPSVARKRKRPQDERVTEISTPASQECLTQ